MFSTSTSDTSNHPNLGVNSAGGYTDGNQIYNNTTDGWVATSGVDMYFKMVMPSSGATRAKSLRWTFGGSSDVESGTTTGTDLKIGAYNNSGAYMDNVLTIHRDTRSTEFHKTVYFAETDNGNSGTSKTITWGSSNKQKLTRTGSCTLTFTAPAGPCSLILKLVHEASATAYTITWPATVKWASATAPTLTNTSGAVDIVSFYYDGTNYYGTYGTAFA